MKRSIPFITALLLAFVAITINAQDAAPDTGKKKITTLAELPRHTYHVTGSVSQMMTSDVLFAPFAAKVRVNIKKVFEDYEIEDKSTLKTLYGILLNLDMIERNYGAAFEGIIRLREMQDKPADRLMSGLAAECFIKAHRETQGGDPAAFRQAFAHHYAAAMNALPWEDVQDQVEQLKGMAEMVSENLLIGVIQSKIEPAVEKTGHISGDVAERLIRYRYLIDVMLPLREERIGVLQSLIDVHKVVKPDIWKERSVDLSATEKLSPVVIAIWDSGVDTDLFPGKLFVNKGEKPDGKDNDGNGFVDDVHGIAYNLFDEKTTGLLCPMEDSVRQRLPQMKRYMKGMLDLQASIDSPEASAFKKKMAEMAPEDVRPFFEDVGRFGQYAHGTHVAGIAARDNPYARILAARITFDYHMIPEPPTVELARKGAAAYKETVGYFKTHGVRVVNMSWGGSPRNVEADLEANGIGKDAEERARLAREIFDISRDGLYEAIKSGPDILFITSAGNSDNDITFDEMIPSSFDLPNILTVGAVDQAGDETSFTSFGEGVDVHANGFEVESYIPGGDRMAVSGTSQSSPNAANLAAKLLAIDPSLKPEEVIALIKKGTDTSEDGRRVLINPKKSVELLAESRE